MELSHCKFGKIKKFDKQKEKNIDYLKITIKWIVQE